MQFLIFFFNYLCDPITDTLFNIRCIWGSEGLRDLPNVKEPLSSGDGIWDGRYFKWKASLCPWAVPSVFGILGLISVNQTEKYHMISST